MKIENETKKRKHVIAVSDDQMVKSLREVLESISDNFDGTENVVNALEVIMVRTEIASKINEFIPVKEYEVDGKKAYLGTNNFQSSGETPMNVLVVLFADLRMTIVINAETDIPVETLETIIKKLEF